MKTQACAYDERVFTTACRCDIIRYKSIYGEYLWSVLKYHLNISRPAISHRQ